MELRGKTALVTGGGVRIGRALALGLAGAGCDLVIHYNRSSEPAEEVREEAGRLGVAAITAGADLAEPEAAEQVIDAAVERFGRLDVLVSSAAIFPENDTLEAAGAAEFDRLVAINLRAPYLLARAFAAARERSGRGPTGSRQPGRIVHLLDARVRRAGADHLVYRLTKRALWALTENLALALAPEVTVNGLALGAILPPPEEEGEDYLESLVERRVPAGRAGSPEIVADNLLHLLRQDFVTGAVWVVDGGEFV